MLFTSFQCFYYWRLLENTIRLEVRASLEENSEAATRGSVKKVFLEISQKSPVPKPPACNFIKKEILAQVFSCEFCEISKNTFSYRAPPMAASENCPFKTSSSFLIVSFQIRQGKPY